MTASANIQRKHLNALDGVRSFACLEIFCSHCLWDGGALGVSLFLILSGFLLAYRYLSQDAAAPLPSATPAGLIRFAWKRLSKLYLLHIIMMVIMVIAQLRQWNTQSGADWSSLLTRIVAHVFLVQTWTPELTVYFSLNGLSWYLSTMHFCYLCFPLLLRLLKKLRTANAAFFSLIVTFGLQVCIAFVSLRVFGISDVDHYYLTYVCPLFRVFDFACGCLLGVLFTKLPAQRRGMLRHTLWEVLAIIAVGITQMIALNRWTFVWGRFSMIFLPASCLAILVFAIGGGYISKIFSAKIIKFFASLTPFVFLIHNRMITAVRTLLGKFDLSGQKYLVAIVSLTVTLFLSYLYLSVRKLWVKKKKAESNCCIS